MGNSRSKTAAPDTRRGRLARDDDVSPVLLAYLNREPASASPLLALQEKISTLFLHGGDEASRARRRLSISEMLHSEALDKNSALCFSREAKAWAAINFPPARRRGMMPVAPPPAAWPAAGSGQNASDWHTPQVLSDLLRSLSAPRKPWEEGDEKERCEEWDSMGEEPEDSSMEEKRHEEGIENSWQRLDDAVPSHSGPSGADDELGQGNAVSRPPAQIEKLLATFDGYVAAARERGKTTVMMVSFAKRIENTTGGIEPDGARFRRPNCRYGFALGIGPEGVVVWMCRPYRNRGGLNHYVADRHDRLLWFEEGRKTAELIKWFAECQVSHPISHIPCSSSLLDDMQVLCCSTCTSMGA